MNVLVDAEGKISPNCSKTHISYSFNIPEEKEKLNIYFSYKPKVLEDKVKSKEVIFESIKRFVVKNQNKYLEQWEEYLPLQNLLTISIDDKNGFRGCAHRHAPKQLFTISQDKTSPGFIQGKIVPGQWTVVISVHAVVTESCNYKLCVWEGDDQYEPMDTL